MDTIHFECTPMIRENVNTTVFLYVQKKKNHKQQHRRWKVMSETFQLSWNRLSAELRSLVKRLLSCGLSKVITIHICSIHCQGLPCPPLCLGKYATSKLRDGKPVKVKETLRDKRKELETVFFKRQKSMGARYISLRPERLSNGEPS